MDVGHCVLDRSRCDQDLIGPGQAAPILWMKQDPAIAQKIELLCRPALIQHSVGPFHDASMCPQYQGQGHHTAAADAAEEISLACIHPAFSIAIVQT